MRLCQKGFGLIETLISAVIGSLILFVVSHQLYQSVAVSADIRSRSELDQAHYLANQRAKNIAFISTALGITDADGNRISPILDRCLNERKHSSDNCATFNKAPSLIESVEYKASDNTSTISSEIHLEMECDAHSCMRVKTTVFSHYVEDSGGNGNPGNPAGGNPGSLAGGVSQTSAPALTRTTSFEMPGKALTSIEQVDFSCALASNRIVSSINLEDRTAQCDGFTGTSTCPDGSPIHQFGTTVSCPSTVTVSCADGVVGTGLFAGSGTCVAAAPPPPPPASPTPASTPPGSTPPPTPPSVLGWCLTAAFYGHAGGGGVALLEAKSINNCNVAAAGTYWYAPPGYDMGSLPAQCYPSTGAKCFSYPGACSSSLGMLGVPGSMYNCPGFEFLASGPGAVVLNACPDSSAMDAVCAQEASGEGLNIPGYPALLLSGGPVCHSLSASSAGGDLYTTSGSPPQTACRIRCRCN